MLSALQKPDIPAAASLLRTKDVWFGFRGEKDKHEKQEHNNIKNNNNSLQSTTDQSYYRT